MFLPAFLSIACLAAISYGASLHTPSVGVKIERVDGVTAKFTVTSWHHSDLRILRLGSILDDLDVQKVNIYSQGNLLDFDGLHLYIDTDNLTETAFVTLPAGGVLEKSFDIARFHNLSAGGQVKIDATGYLEYAAPKSTKLTGIIPYESSYMTTVEASRELPASKEHTRALVSRETCLGDSYHLVKGSLSLCYKHARGAAEAAKSGPAKRLVEYFKSDSSETRRAVAGVFEAIAKECNNFAAGKVSMSCANTDICRDNAGVVAYATGLDTVFCPDWFKQPARGKCRQVDRAGVILHEFGHSLGGLKDFGVYGYDAVRRLPAPLNIYHADTYAFFANAVAANC